MLGDLRPTRPKAMGMEMELGDFNCHILFCLDPRPSHRSWVHRQITRGHFNLDAPELYLLEKTKTFVPMKANLTKCLFCNASDNLTSEHIPPKSLFPTPRPHNLITVPSCNTCNGSFQKDEEYFRVAISCLCGDSTKFQNLLIHNVTKQLSHQPKLATTIQRDSLLIKVKEEILYGVSSKNPRINTVIQKIVKGLYFHERKTPLPRSQEILWNFIDAAYIKEMGTNMCRALKNLPIHDIGNGVF